MKKTEFYLLRELAKHLINYPLYEQRYFDLTGDVLAECPWLWKKDWVFISGRIVQRAGESSFPIHHPKLAIEKRLHLDYRILSAEQWFGLSCKDAEYLFGETMQSGIQHYTPCQVGERILGFLHIPIHK